MNSWNGKHPGNEIALIDPKGFCAGFQQRRRPQEKMIPHIGLAYVAAGLEKNGETVRVLDAGVATYREMQRFLSKPAYLFGITCASHTLGEGVQVSRAVKARYPSTPVLLGGPHVSLDPQSCLQDPAVDYALQGEGEEAFIDFLEVLKRNPRPTATVLSAIAGLVYRDQGQTRVNPPGPRLGHLDDLPYPAWHLFPMNRYRRHVLLTSRGGSLAGGFFSAENIWGRQRSNRQPGLVAAEAEWLLARWGRKPVHFQDEDLAADPEHAAALCQTFLQHRLRSAWFAQASPGAALTAEWLRLLRRAGCQQLLLELVSADPDVLEAIGQPGPEALAQAVRTCREAGLAVAGVFFVGAPKDTEAAVMRSLAFAREQRIDLPRFNLAVPFPKSRLREYADSHGRFVSPDESAGGARSAEPVFETPEFAAEARRRVFKTACEFSRRQCRYYHIRFWWPPNLLRRTGFEITQELRTWIRAWQWPFRRLRYLWRCHDKVRRNP